ncbi:MULTISPECIES: MurR/RpiR family transcriptional regulator [Enterobacteriaceae]|jgi:DNA-binding MurR/RpiR family transcriptional regulator|uniref:MurR/RpiR family transcriptional regulator n=2 Tax=Enterobacteriaceae TaxID=543 RepID=A0ABW1Q5J5_9ENTR|nr:MULTISPECIES: MurR/RpiR family transcriptional regulator [Phytobacter]AUU89495.1 MurR/RpiR family transcriptional regulator [Enterobacteriaceae bacterium ENNIH3]AUV05170.1 MurR/RpiR family transcriptional regulator [Enterobacteriaceae bacterium ENNIH2]MBS6740748.1 MurR/RpiR family transcriptional regulator [Enterobacteriaceae bacterium]PTA89052.1 MurR/RpiR family transcriptional regulator [Kluyvera sp. Nf5]PWF52035.1 MurR/RpiR family transcriptional regulator [[Kluyvera] intestini]PXW56007
MQQLDTRLRECYNELSPQEQRVASFIMDHFDDLMSYNSAELARLSGVSKATVSRLFKRLGYDRFKEMRDEVRTLRQSGMPLTENRDAVQGNTLLARHYKQEMANLTQWVNALDAVQFADVVQALGAAQRVFILGLRNSAPVALHLRQQLMQIRGQVSLMPQPGQTLAEELVDITPQDVVVVVAFRRRPRVIRPVLEALHKQGVPTVAISEPQAAGITTLARWHFGLPLDSVSAFDSYSSAMSLVNLLANALLHSALTEGRQRIHNIASLYTELDELEQR